MTGQPPHFPEGPNLLLVRHAVRSWITDRSVNDTVCVGLSGGADSLALTAACVAEALRVRAVVVDHALQPGSADVAEAAAERARDLGCDSAEVVTVVVDGPGGPEAAARRARYAALDSVRGELPVLLGHTLDDQAETVLLGLARGSGPRSLRGMAPWDAPYGRPLLGVRRSATVGACAELGLDPWQDPQNTDPSFTRVRLRHEVLPLLEDVLRGGVADALARTAEQLREDGDVLDARAAELLDLTVDHGALELAPLSDVPAAIRRRVVREWLGTHGVPVRSDGQLRAVDDLIGRWRGQGGVAVAGGTHGERLVAVRRRGKLHLVRQTDRTRLE